MPSWALILPQGTNRFGYRSASSRVCSTEANRPVPGVDRPFSDQRAYFHGGESLTRFREFLRGHAGILGPLVAEDIEIVGHALIGVVTVAHQVRFVDLAQGNVALDVDDSHCLRPPGISSAV
jgi:hypothetical protein